MAVAAVIAVQERQLSPAARDDDDEGKNGMFSTGTNAFSRKSTTAEFNERVPFRKLLCHILSMQSGAKAMGRRTVKIQASEHGLRRKQLLERVEMETVLSMGVKRLALWLATFTMLILFVKLPKDPSAQLGVQELIEDNMNIHPFELEAITDIGKVWTLLQGIDEKASVFNPASSVYLPDSEYLRMVGNRKTFQRPVLYPSTDPLLSSKFSIVAWVKALDEGTTGTLVRKFTTQNVDRSCWSFNYPGEFRYGAHDVGLREWSQDEEIIVSASLPTSQTWHLEGITVDGMTLRFFRDDAQIEEIQLRRDITDCVGILAVGDAGLEISDLRIFPRALNAGELTEIAYGGATLADIASGSNPMEPEVVTNVQSIIDQSLTQTEQELETRYNQQLLADLRGRAELRSEIVSRLGGNVEVAAVVNLPQDASFECWVSSPCRLRLLDSEPAATTNMLGTTPFGGAASDESVVPSGSGLLLVPGNAASGTECQGTFAALEQQSLAASSVGLVGRHDAAGPCTSGAACTADLQAKGVTHAAWWLMDMGIPSGEFEATVCYYSQINQASPLQRLGTLHVHNYPGFVQVAPDTTLWRGADWPLFPHPVFHTRTYDSNDRFSLSFWTRLRLGNGTLEGIGNEVGIGLLRMYAGLDKGGKWCWNTKIYHDRFQHYGGFHQPTGVRATHCYIPQGYTLATPVLRHTAWVFDDHDDQGNLLGSGGMLRVYLDGQKVCSLPLVYKPSELECPGQAKDFFMTYLSDEYYASQPEGDAPSAGKFETGQDVKDSRFYPDVALSDAEVASLADSPLKECREKAAVTDSRYEDAAGNGCQWYYDMIQKGHSNVCDAAAQIACPLVCNSYQFCFPGASEELETVVDANKWAVVEESRQYHVWERVKAIGPRTICLSDNAVAEDILARCRAQEWVEGAGQYDWELAVGQENPSATKGHVDFSNCTMLEEMIDPSCTFSGAVMDTINNAATESQEYTVAFWAKGPFFWQSLASVYPPRAQTFFSSNIDGGRVKLMQAPTNLTGGASDSCVGAVDLWTNVFKAGEDVREDRWEFYAFSFYNDTSEGVKGNAFFGGQGAQGGWALGRICPEPISALLFLAEGDSYVSPIRMWGRALPLADITNIFYAESSLYVDTRTTGPRRNDVERQATRQMSPEPFRLPTFLIAPPLVSQRRESLAEECSGMSHDVLLNVMDRVNARCSNGSRCSIEGENGAGAWLQACRSEQSPNRFFGRDAINLAGEPSFAEFVASLSADVVLRDGTVRLMRSFLDQFTHTADLVMLFLSPQLTWNSHKDIVSILKVRFEFQVPVVSTVSVKHVELLPDENVPYLILTGLLCGVLVIIALVDAVVRIVAMCRGHGTLGDNMAQAVFDLLITILNAPLLIMRTVQVASANEDIHQAVRKVSSIQWGDPSVTFESKVGDFFDGTDSLLSLANRHDVMDIFTLIVLVLILCRLLLSFSAHPRIALITSTVKHGADNIWHFLVVAGVISLAFATVAWWFFGARHENFRTIKLALGVEYNLLITGELPEGYEDDVWLEIFGYIFVIVVFFLLLNILLAIIVEAYLAVKSVVEATDVEQAFFTDILYVTMNSLISRRHRWPAREALLQWLRSSIDAGDEEPMVEKEAVDNVGFTVVGWRWFVEMYRPIVGSGEKPNKDKDEGRKSVADRIAAKTSTVHESDTVTAPPPSSKLLTEPAPTEGSYLPPDTVHPKDALVKAEAPPEEDMAEMDPHPLGIPVIEDESNTD